MDINLPGEEFKNIFYSSPAPMLVIGIDARISTILYVNNAYLITTKTNRANVICKPLFGVFPANPAGNVSKNIERTIFHLRR